jgi:hypothetical protein
MPSIVNGLVFILVALVLLTVAFVATRKKPTLAELRKAFFEGGAITGGIFGGNVFPVLNDKLERQLLKAYERQPALYADLVVEANALRTIVNERTARMRNSPPRSQAGHGAAAFVLMTAEHALKIVEGRIEKLRTTVPVLA